MPLNQWAHLAATWDGTAVRYYINGAEVGSTTNPPIAATAGLTIGSRYGGSYAATGRLDEVALFPRALTAAEVQAHSQGSLLGDALGDACDPCPGNADPSCQPAGCTDEDGDGYGVPGASSCAAGHPELFDCNDHDASVHPGAVDVPWDGRDNDCNGYPDEPMMEMKTYEWDGNGNLVSDGTATYAWDARDRLVSTTGSANYGYDANNLRVSMGGQQVLLDGIEEAREYGGNELRFDHDPSRVDGLLAQKSGASKGYFVTDALGSVYGVVDSTGMEVSKYSYDVYGARTASTENVATSWGFTGRRHDSSTEMYYRARYLDANLASWTAVDPVATSIHLYPVEADDGPSVGRQLGNPYGYVLSGPTNHRDPEGMIFGISLGDVDVLLDLAEQGVLYPITLYFEGNVALSIGWECSRGCQAAFAAGTRYSAIVIGRRIPLAMNGRDPRNGKYFPWSDSGHRDALIFDAALLELAGLNMLRQCRMPASLGLATWYITIGGMDVARFFGRGALRPN